MYYEIGANEGSFLVFLSVSLLRNCYLSTQMDHEYFAYLLRYEKSQYNARNFFKSHQGLTRTKRFHKKYCIEN